jgi:lipopolysaccharide biosynthesis glycosyltransferase
MVLAFDDGFWAPAYATMRSVCISTRRRADLRFHLFHWKLAADHKALLDDIAREYGATLVHTALDADPGLVALISALPASEKFPPVIYARLLMDRLLPPEVERFAYLDADLYVRAPIENLLGIDLEGRTLAAAPEPGRHHLVLGDDMRTRQWSFDSADPYFNSGVLVVDRARWGAARLPDFLESLVASGEIRRLFTDQDVLNLAFRGDFVRLDPRWNLTKPHPAVRSLDPFIIHYTTEQKPWNRIAYVAFGSSYRHVMTREILARYRRERLVKRLRKLFRSR